MIDLFLALDPPVVHHQQVVVPERAVLAGALFPPPKGSQWTLPADTRARHHMNGWGSIPSGSVVEVLNFWSVDEDDYVLVRYNGDFWHIPY